MLGFSSIGETAICELEQAAYTGSATCMMFVSPTLTGPRFTEPEMC